MTQNRNSTRWYSDRHEKQVASELDLDVQVSSGSRPFHKGDVVSRHITIDCKTVTKPQKAVSIPEAWFKKIDEESITNGTELSGIAFNYEPGGDSYVAVPITQFRKLLDCYREINEE